MSSKPTLESDLYDLVNMAHILATLLEDSFGNKKTHWKITRLPNTYYLGEEDTDAMIFASYDIHHRLRALRDKYQDSMGLEK